MGLPIISVIIPVYNVEPFLCRCLDSITNQTYKHLDIILVNDGSTDQCGTICDDYAAKDSRIRVIHQKNGGLSDARNAGLDIAKGNYILFVDSDAWIEKEACETIITTAEEQHADLVWFDRREVFPSGEIRTLGLSPSGEIEKSEMMRKIVYIAPTNTVWNKLYSRELLEGIRFPKGRIYEDVCVIHELIHRAHRIYATNAILYNYIRRDDSLASKRYSPRSIKDILFAWNKRLVFLEQHYPTYADKMRGEILRQMIIGHELLKGDPDYTSFLSDFQAFEQQYHSRLKAISKGCRLNQLYRFCPSLAYLYVRWSFRNRNKK